uniref:C-type lectin domain-containing protein n=1 Tax=Panagrolaimus davidi TaxID=227884 RepID=A0A914PN93_9BILA
MIGFWIPKKLKWNPANFQWSDGSTVDFIGWDIKGIPKQPDNQIPAERFVKLRKKFKSSGWHDFQFKEMKKVLCKMNAFENTNAKTTLLPTKSSSENITPLSTTEKIDTSTTKTTNKELEVASTSDKTPDTVSTGKSTEESTTTTQTTPSATTSTVSESTQSTTTETTTVSSTTETEVIATTTTTFIDKDIVILDGAKP